MKRAVAAVAGLLLFVGTAAYAAKLECYEAPGTLDTMCIEPAAVRANGDVRSSPVYMGGPNSVRSTAIKLITDCKRGVTTLQDAEGRNFAGGRSGETPAVKALSSWVCNVPKPKPDARLRQF